MNFYFAGITKVHMKIIEEREIPIKPNLLFSMAYMTPTLHEFIDYLRSKTLVNKLALDSGAFSLNMNKNLKLTEKQLFHRFLYFAEANYKKFDMIINFDSIFSAAGFKNNYRNLLRLHEAGIPAWPVAHDYINKDYKRLSNIGYNNIAFGQGIKRKFSILFDACISCLLKGVSIHMLGVGSARLLPHIPCASADSKSALDHARFGKIIFYNNDKPDYIKLPKKDVNEDKSDLFQEKKEHYLQLLSSKEADLKWSDLQGDERASFATVANMLFYDELEKRATENHKKMLRYLFTGKMS